MQPQTPNCVRHRSLRTTPARIFAALSDAAKTGTRFTPDACWPRAMSIHNRLSCNARSVRSVLDSQSVARSVTTGPRPNRRSLAGFRAKSLLRRQSGRSVDRRIRSGTTLALLTGVTRDQRQTIAVARSRSHGDRPRSLSSKVKPCRNF